jgi:hypothetical protein
MYIVCGTKTNRALRFAGLILFRQSKRHDSLLFFFSSSGKLYIPKRIQCLPVMHKEAQMRRAISIGTDGWKRFNHHVAIFLTKGNHETPVWIDAQETANRFHFLFWQVEIDPRYSLSYFPIKFCKKKKKNKNCPIERKKRTFLFSIPTSIHDSHLPKIKCSKTI